MVKQMNKPTNKIDTLINELCPEGVDFKELGEVADYRRGSFPQPYGESRWYNGENAMPFVQVADVAKNMSLVKNTKQKISKLAQSKSVFVPMETVIVTLQGSIGRVAITQYDSYVDRTLAIFERFKVEINKKYFAYQLEKKFTIEKETARGSTIKTITKAEFTKFKIPIPPLAVQEEIVKILDNFTELEAELGEELGAELEARKKQYAYYQEELLTFGDEVEWQSLVDACNYVDYRGKTPKKTDRGIFLVTAKNIRKGYIDYDASQEFISESDYNVVMRRGMPALGDVLITTEAPCGFVAQVDKENIALAQRVIKYRSKSKSLVNSFLKHYLLGRQFQEKLQRTATGSTVKGIKGSKLHKLTIPVPSLAEQKRIVKILDKFDALINDISIGLPAELKARRQQYEYYREKLLTFKEKTLTE